MTQQKQVYRCYVCGNVVEVLTAGGGELVCCGAKMVLLAEKTAGAGREKHLPRIERSGACVRVRVGEEVHPMEPSHAIEWIDAACGGVQARRHLAAGEAPEVEFELPAGEVVVRACCSRHGLWQATLGGG